MSSKILSGLIVGFWVVMMVALVRMEYTGQMGAMDAVPTGRILQKLLSNSSPARLNVFHVRDGKTNWVGFANLDVLKLATLDPVQIQTNETDRVAGYRLRVDARVDLAKFGMPSRLHLAGSGLLNSRSELRQFQVQADFGDGRVDVQSPDAQRVDVVVELGDTHETRSFNLRDFQGAGLGGGLGLPGLTAGGRGSPASFRVGYERLTAPWGGQRAYAAEYRLDPKTWVKAWVSELGEVLLVETPWGVMLADEQLLTEDLREQTPSRHKVTKPVNHDSDRTSH